MPSASPFALLVTTAALIGALACPLEARAQLREEPHEDHGETDAEHEEADEIIVQGTRTRRRIQDEPIRVEVITREEIEEKLLMRPGAIGMLVNETPGVRVQVTSPALRAAKLRIQGMEGRYTQLLAEGLPL